MFTKDVVGKKLWIEEIVETPLTVHLKLITVYFLIKVIFFLKYKSTRTFTFAG